VCLTGASGSGKTLFLRAIADLDPHEGRVLVDGAACRETEAPVWRRRVGLLPAESRWWRATVGEHMEALDPGWLDALALPRESLAWPVTRLSSGERQRLAMLRVLSRRPEVLLLDEPTANLDSDAIRRAEALLADYRSRHATAGIWVSHDPAQARRVAKRVLRLEAGRLVPA
jgi:putative ABC transport system ATP-binding protein